jgi:hypothetical protein
MDDRQRALVILHRTWIGMVLATASIACGVVVARLWGSSLGTTDWRVVSLAVIVVCAIGLATIEELGRPQNPYRNIDPRFSYMDAGPKGEVHSASTSWILHLAPLALTSLVLIAWLILI